MRIWDGGLLCPEILTLPGAPLPGAPESGASRRSRSLPAHKRHESGTEATGGPHRDWALARFLPRGGDWQPGSWLERRDTGRHHRESVISVRATGRPDARRDHDRRALATVGLTGRNRGAGGRPGRAWRWRLCGRHHAGQDIWPTRAARPEGSDGSAGSQRRARAAGPAGTIAATSIVAAPALTSSPDAAVGTVLVANTSCPIGKVVLSGGVQVSASSTQADRDVELRSSFPFSTTDWQTVAIVTRALGTGVSMTMTPYLVCVCVCVCVCVEHLLRQVPRRHRRPEVGNNCCGSRAEWGSNAKGSAGLGTSFGPSYVSLLTYITTLTADDAWSVQHPVVYE